MIISTNEPKIVLVDKEFLILRHYQVDVKNIKYLLQWWEEHKNMFRTIGFCIKQIFGIVGYQIEIEKIFY
jgi:hypothetical protein